MEVRGGVHCVPPPGGDDAHAREQRLHRAGGEGRSGAAGGRQRGGSGAVGGEDGAVVDEQGLVLDAAIGEAVVGGDEVPAHAQGGEGGEGDAGLGCAAGRHALDGWVDGMGCLRDYR